MSVNLLDPGVAESVLQEVWPELTAPDESWRARAVCAQTDPEAFFPEKGGSTREAKKVCLGCEVRAECLEYALVHDERFGIWGGLGRPVRTRTAQGQEARHLTPSTQNLHSKEIS